MSRLRAVLIDDNKVNLMLMKCYLDRMDLDVRCSDDPAKALRDAAGSEPDIVFVDYMMPRMDGIQFTAAFRKQNTATPVVMITGSADDDAVKLKALKAGATEFIRKPVDSVELYLRASNLLHLKQYQNMLGRKASALEREVKKEEKEVADSERETLLVLAKTADHKDPETGSHVMRVAQYSRLLAEALRADGAFCDMICYCAPLHDVGKVGIPDRILQKKGKLTEEEFGIMKRHTLIGYDILDNTKSKYLMMGKSIAVSHHEKYDGSGYPYGLSGSRIPIEGRIVAVADVFDALLSKRPYKRGWSVEETVRYVASQKGRQFDPNVVEAFLGRIDQFVNIYKNYNDDFNAWKKPEL